MCYIDRMLTQIVILFLRVYNSINYYLTCQVKADCQIKAKCQVKADCLSNSLVLRKLLQHFSNSELLKISLVNKLWNYEARSLMKKRNNLIARLNFSDNRPCQEYLDVFAADLLRMNLVPFSGIRIELYPHHIACEFTALNSSYNTILDRLPLKSVSFTSTGDWSKHQDCAGSRLAIKALQHFSGVLEQVSITKCSYMENLFVEYILDCSFPSLKVLKLGEDYYGSDAAFQSRIKAMVASATKLQELHMQGPISLMLNVLEGGSTVLVVQSDVSAPFNEIPENVINTIRLERIQLNYTGPNFNVERFNRVTPLLLQASCTETIESMTVDAFLAVPLMCYGIRLENVNFLTMNVKYGLLERAEPRILRFVKNFDFTRIFPNLAYVRIDPCCVHPEASADHLNGFVGQANANLNEPEPDRAINIKELYASTGISSANAHFFAEMFPHIERLQVNEEDEKVCFGSIWKHWVDLKDVDVRIEVQKHFEDLESAICGIFPEEVAELRQKDEEFLRKVNIVPVMPAITCLRNLRKFTLVFAHLGDRRRGVPSLGYIESTPLLILSKVTGLLAFARCPHLAVKIYTFDSHVQEAMKQMEPYASVCRLRLSCQTED